MGHHPILGFIEFEVVIDMKQVILAVTYFEVGSLSWILGGRCVFCERTGTACPITAMIESRSATPCAYLLDSRTCGPL
jgi:hypothetical protein